MSLLHLLSSPSLQSYSEIPDNLTFHFMTTAATAAGGRNITLKTGEHNPQWDNNREPFKKTCSQSCGFGPTREAAM